MEIKPIVSRDFGRSNRRVTVVGLGGEGVLRTYDRAKEARNVIQTAIAEGFSYYDSARVYSDSEVYYGSIWHEQPADRNRIFQASKSASRRRGDALRDLDGSLERLQAGFLDLWQIHDLRTEQDFNTIAGPGGALEAFTEAKANGRIGFIGVTGHHDPNILTRAVREWPVDAVMMPVNPSEAILGGFLTSTLPAAKEKGIAVIGMKILGGGSYPRLSEAITPELLIRFALSKDVTVAIVGCSTPEEVRTLAAAGRHPEPLSAEEERFLLDAFEPYAARLAFYRGVI
jgi:predicted aldo/keto reductase-like oxidoreductase